MKHKNVLILLLCLTVLFIIRILPTLHQPLGTLSYDYGFYLYAANHPYITGVDLVNGTFDNPLFLLFNHIELSPETALNLSYLTASLLVGLGLFLLFKNKAHSFWAIILLALSIPQSEAHTLYLWKYTLASFILLLSFKFIIEQKYPLLLLSSSLIFLTHRSTSIIYFTCLLIFSLFELLKQKKYILAAYLSIGVMLLGAIAFAFIKPSILQFLNHPNPALRDGIFLNNYNFASLTWVYIIFTILGLYFYIKNKQHPLLIIFFLVSLSWVIFKLPFYNRVLLYVDLGLIIFASYYLSKINFKQLSNVVLIGIVMFVLASNVVKYNLNKTPIITESEIDEIKYFSAPNGFVLALSGQDAPWLLGYLQNKRLAAPGLFEDVSTYEQWLDFWSGQSSRSFLNKYPKPLFLYQRSFKIQGEIENCLNSHSENFSQYICD